MKRSWLLEGYRIATRLLEPLAPRLLDRRLARGKEDGERLGERLGIAGRPRPEGTLVWLHGASVGEAASMLPLDNALIERNCRVLVTTGTATSAQLLARRLPSGATHQFVPVDGARFFRHFLAHWRPALALIAESELWPNMICETHQAGVPIVLINARISARSAARWGKARGLIRALLHRVDLFLAQTVADADRFLALGAQRVRVAGNLKYDVPPPTFAHEELALLTAHLSARPVWIAASTHEGEENIVADVHLEVAKTFPRLLTIVAPRHPERGAALDVMLRGRGLSVATRTRGEVPADTGQIYLVDTIGDLGTMYRLAGIVFLGKSLVGRGGQNPIEPVHCGCVVVHGPHVHNFSEAYKLLDEADAALAIADADGLRQAIAGLLADPARTRMMARKAAVVVERQTGTVHRIMQAITPYLPDASPSTEDAATQYPYTQNPATEHPAVSQRGNPA